MAGDSELETSASVSFDGKATLSLSMETDSDASLPKAKGKSYVRVFPSFAGAKVTAVKGSAVKLASNVPAEIVEYVSFGGTSSASLKYSAADGVTISEKSFFNATPTVVYDEASNSIILDKVAYGICRVAYVAYFDRYLASHGDAPCKAINTQTSGGQPPPSTKQVNYDPVFLVATATGWDTASIEIAGPPCSDGEGGLNKTQQFSDYDATGYKVEVDIEVPVGINPIYYRGGDTPLGFNLSPQYVLVGDSSVLMYAGCRIRVYPKESVTLTAVNCSVNTQIRSSGSKPVLQSLVFSGTQSTNLEYPPSSKVTLGLGSVNAISNFGESVDVNLRGPGEWVNEVEWKDKNTYEVTQGARKLREDEVVVVTSLGNNTLPCYTFGQARYTSDYNTYEMLFHFDSELDWYAPAMILVSGASGKMGYIQIDPPGKGGIL